jgi:hypothetical protein
MIEDIRVHLHEHALGLASLPADDPERRAAAVHTRDCPDCAQALRQAERLLGKLDAALPPPSLPPRTLESIARPILGRLAAAAVPVGLLSAVLVAIWGALVLTAKHRVPLGAAWAESLALVVAALACVRAVRRIGAAAAAIVFGAFVLTWAPAGLGGELGARHGVACLLTETVAAVVPLAILARRFLRRRSANPSAGLLAGAAAGALVGQAALRLTCGDATEGLHLLVFHGGGLLLAALVAWGLSGPLGRRALRRPAA